MNALPIPRPIAKQARKIVGKKAVCGPTVLNRTRPDDRARHPADAAPAAAPKRSTSRAVMPRDRIATVIVHGRNAAPVCERAVMADVLEVQRAEEERRVHAGDQKAADEAWPSEPPQAQDPQRHDRVLDPASSATKAAIRTARQRAEAEHLRRAPAVVGRLDDRVDRAHQRGRYQQRAEPVDAVREPADPRRQGSAPGRARTRAAPIGRLTKNIQCQLRVWVSTPPASRPSEPPATDDEHVGAHRAGALGGLGKLGRR